MPKLKTHSGAKDRFKVTKNGKVMHGHAGSNHMMAKKSTGRKRRFAISTVLTGKSASNMKSKLGA